MSPSSALYAIMVEPSAEAPLVTSRLEQPTTTSVIVSATAATAAAWRETLIACTSCAEIYGNLKHSVHKLSHHPDC
eukprot:m.437846 g.437846  ORF g.437846 m.437846 type:complete len:76 (-) comp18166_c0_seq1:1150-1377(-)